jgi:basic membrane protein A
LTDATGIEDRSYNASAWRGFLEFYGDTDTAEQRGVYYDIVTAQTPDMYIPNILQATDEGYDLLIATGFSFADTLAEAARDHPNQNYLIVDPPEDMEDFPNLLKAVYAEHEGSYLAGAAAALKAKADGIANPVFGFIGGIPGPLITKFEIGFVQGVLSVLPNAQFVDHYVNSWAESGLAKVQAKKWYDLGVYAIYSAAGISGLGAIYQAREYREAGLNVWAVGVDSDQHNEGLYNEGKDSAVLTSMVKRVDQSIVYALNMIKNNEFKGELITFDIKAGGIGYTTTNTAITEDIKSELRLIQQMMALSRIKVASSYAEARFIEGFPQDLQAID